MNRRFPDRFRSRLDIDFSLYPKSHYVFHRRIYKLVDDPSTDSIISWSKSNNSFVIWNQDELVRRKMLWIFCCNSLTEFISKLKFNGFEEIKESDGQWEFGNKKFVRGKPELLAEMQYYNVMRMCFAKPKPSQAVTAEAEVKDGLQSLRI
ncbi:unnamed protein product [Thlaspi arvense]|uniref:HSF-type DNA-binding domain-containing protein n=1 Tax=Thlaspi arvense TaxID=13288 RepID=A0AAU9TBR1_THLAR|nr:unnamed protein product [Thlaspi arvense]